MSKKKEKKEKIKYVDDGRTIADMSGVSDRRRWLRGGTTSSVRDIWSTYWNATKMMFLPTLAVVGLLLTAFLIVALIFKIM